MEGREFLARTQEKESYGVKAPKSRAVGGELVGESLCLACGCVFRAMQGTAELLTLGDNWCEGAQKFGGDRRRIGDRKRRTGSKRRAIKMEDRDAGRASRSSCCAFARVFAKIIKSRILRNGLLVG
jgi:hypothetical protein